MNLNLTSVCGCGIEVATDGADGVVTLRSGDTLLTRRHEDGGRGVEEVIVYLWSAGFAIAADQEDGVLRSNFCDPSYYEPSLGLEMEVELVDDSNLHPRAKFVLVADDHDSLDYCHVGVTLDLSLQQLRDTTEVAYSTTRYGR